MASVAIIIQQIETTVRRKYADWLIGVTVDSAERKAELGNPLNWVQWQADSPEDALNVLRHFSVLGMQPSGSTTAAGDVVYILLSDNPSSR